MDHIYFISGQFRRRQQTLEAKVSVLENMWVKLKGKLISKNTEIGGKKTRDMINEIIKIDPAIKFAALKEFVLSC